MLKKLFRKLDYHLSWAGLIIIFIGTVLAVIYGGVSRAVLAGLILFFVFDGVGCVWTIINRATAETLHQEADDAGRASFNWKSRDNPTLR